MATTSGSKIFGLFDTTAGSVNTSFNSGDQIDGKDGSGSLDLTIVGAAAGTSSGAIVKNVGTINVSNSTTTGGSFNYDASTTTGMKAFKVTSSVTQGTTLSNQAGIVDASMSNGKGSLTISYTATTVAGAADTQKLAVSGQTGGTFTADGIETIELTGGAVTSKSFTLAGAQLSTVKVLGSGDVSFTIPSTTRTVDASAATGKVSVSGSNSTLKVTGGTGADTITFTGTMSTLVTVDGGDGADTLSVSSDVNGTEFTNVKNVETLSVASTGNITGLDVSKVTGLSTVLGQLKNTTPGTRTIDFQAAADNGDTIAITVDGVTTTYTAAAGDTAATIAAAFASSGSKTLQSATMNATAAGSVLTLIDTGIGSVVTIKGTNASGGSSQSAKINGSSTATGLDGYTNTVSANAQASATLGQTTGSMTLSKVADGSTVLLSSKNLSPISTATTTVVQNTPLNQMGAVTVGVTNATTAAATDNKLTVQLNNDNATSTASAAGNKIFTVNSVTADGVETVTIDSIGSFGANRIRVLDLDNSNTNSTKSIVVTGSQELTLSSIAATGNAIDTAITAGLDASAFTGKFTAAFASSTYGDQVIKGGSGADAITMYGLNSGDTVDLGAGSNKLTTVLTGDASIVNLTNVQSLVLASSATAPNASTDAAAIDLRNSPATKSVDISAHATNVSVQSLADGATVSISDGSTSGKGVTLGSLGTGATLNVTVGYDQSGSTLLGNAGGHGTQANPQGLTVTGAKTLNVTFDGADLASATTPATAASYLGTVSLGSVTDLTMTLSNWSGATGLAPVTSVASLTSPTTTALANIVINGGSGVAQRLTLGALADFTNLAKIDASAANASVNVGWDGTTADSFRMKSGGSVVLGAGDDVMVWQVSTNGTLAIDGGSSSTVTTSTGDTLRLLGTQNIGPSVIDLSSVTDQVATFNGAANAAIQVGFEHLDASGIGGTYGVQVTGGSGVNALTGTAYADVLDGGAGNDVITGGAGADVIDGGTGVDTYIAGDGAAIIVTLNTSTAATVTVIGGTDDTIVNIENVIGTSGNDIITGDSAANTLNGDAGHDLITGGAGADSITAGEGTDIVTIGDGQDTVSLTETTAVGDTLIWNTAFAAGNTNAATVTGFAFGAGADVFDMQQNLSNGNTTATSSLVGLTPLAVASDGTATANGVIFTFNGAGDLLAAGTTVANAVANAVTALTSGTDFSSANIATGDSLILQMNDGTNTFVFHYVADGTPATTAAADLALIGVFSGTTVQALVGDFI